MTTGTFDPRIGEIARSEHRHLLDIAFRMLGDVGRAEDMVQEAFVRLARQDLDGIAIAPIRDPSAVATMVEAGEGQIKDIELLLDVCRNIGGKTLCPFGDAEIAPVVSTIKHFRAEYEAHVHEGRCTLPADWRASGTRVLVGKH